MSSLNVVIDCHYTAPRIACAYLLCEKGEAAFVENNTAHALPHLTSALDSAGYKPEQVRYVIITHVHLDHAGASGHLMQRFPNATLLCHPRAARHVIDPARLVSSARTVYGNAEFDRLYGEILPVPQARVQIMEDESTISFGERTLRFLHTRGHANHHFCVVDEKSSGVFTGDSFGIAYPDAQKNGPFIFPSTTPTEFDPAEARKSVERIASIPGLEHAYLTHFGSFDSIALGREQLLEGIAVFEEILNECTGMSDPERTNHARKRVQAYFERRAGADAQLLAMDVELNAQGISFAAGRR
jgi:glyoxylase-like metal-dependent hydrolase (beta-lactamase superfamily II)